MPLADTISRVRSGVFHIVCNRGGQRVASGSAFLTCGYLVTNFHVTEVPADLEIWIRREGDGDAQGVRMKGEKFRQSIKSGSDRDNYDFAVLDIPEVTGLGDAHSFTLRHPKDHRVGDPIAFLGYPFEHQNLVCHSGVISSFYRSGPANVLQLDASVNPSNSGGPVFDPESGEVLAIVTRKATGLSRAFTTLRNAIGSKLNLMSDFQSKGPNNSALSAAIIRLMRMGQEDLQATLHEIERQANVGIGYAISIEHLMADNPIHDRLTE